MFFSKALYFQVLKKLRSIGIGMATTVLVLNTLYSFFEADIPSLSSSVNYIESYGRDTVHSGEIAPFTFIVVIFSFFLVSSAFSFLNDRKGSDFYHSIPDKRICVYVSFISAIISWICAVIFATLFINFLMFSASESHSISFLQVLIAFLGYTLSTLALASIVTFARMLSGTTIAYVFYSACLLFVPRAFSYIFGEAVCMFNHTIYLKRSFLKWVLLEKSPYQIFMLFDSKEIFSDAFTFFIMLIEAVIFFALSGVLYNKRKSEIAGMAVPSKNIQRIFTILIALPLTSFAVYITIEDGFDYFLLFIITSVSLLFIFLSELIISKNVKKAVASLPLFLVSIVISIATVISASVVAYTYRQLNPVAEKIGHVTIVDGAISDANRKIFNKQISPDNSEIIAELLYNLEISSRSDFRHYPKYLLVKFTYKDGSETYREIYFYDISKIYTLLEEHFYK